MSITNEEKVAAYERITSHLEFNQAYTQIDWSTASLLRVGKGQKERYQRVLAQIDSNLAELRRMYVSGHYNQAEQDVIQMVANHTKVYRGIILHNLKCLESYTSQLPLDLGGTGG